MIISLPSAWQVRRSHFNHQWLKNRYISALDSFLNLLSGRFRATGMLEDFFKHDLPEWESRYPECKSLLHDFESEMSPRFLFESEPLSGWDCHLREAVGEFVHQLWLSRHPVETWIANVNLELEKTNKLYENLCSGIEIREKYGDPIALQKQFDAFRSSCEALSRAIEELPNRILVV